MPFYTFSRLDVNTIECINYFWTTKKVMQNGPGRVGSVKLDPRPTLTHLATPSLRGCIVNIPRCQYGVKSPQHVAQSHGSDVAATDTNPSPGHPGPFQGRTAPSTVRWGRRLSLGGATAELWTARDFVLREAASIRCERVSRLDVRKPFNGTRRDNNTASVIAHR